VLVVIYLLSPLEESAVVFVDSQPVLPLAILVAVGHEAAACAPLVLLPIASSSSKLLVRELSMAIVACVSRWKTLVCNSTGHCE